MASNLFKIIFQAVYNVVQYIMPHMVFHQEKPQKAELLDEVCLSLLISVTSDKLPSDCALITATSICIIVSYISEENKEHFLRLLITVSEILEKKSGIRPEKFYELVSECYHSRLAGDEILEEKFGDIKPSHPVLLVLYGLFNSRLQWIYHVSGENDVSLGANVKYLNESESCKGTDLHQPVQEQTLRIGDVKDGDHVFLYEIYPFINKLCRGARSYTFQAFQVRETNGHTRKDK